MQFTFIFWCKIHISISITMISISVYMVYISNDTMQSTFIFWCTIHQTLPNKSSFKMVELTISTKLDWGFYITSIAKTHSRKIGTLIAFMKFPFLRLHCIINLPQDYAYNPVVISGLVLLVVTWNLWLSYKNGHAGVLSFTCCLF